MKSKVICTVIDFGTTKFKYRLKYLFWNLIQPYIRIKDLRLEFRDWSKRGILDTRWRRILYLLDHFVIWPFRVIYVVIKGGAVEGLSWEVDLDG